jgi:hypothetical protein
LIAQHRPASLEGGAVVGHLLAVPAAAYAEQEPAAGDDVEARRLLGGVDRIPLDQKADAGADQQLLRSESRGGERDEWIHRVHVHPRQLAARRIRALPAHRDMRMLRDP